MARTRSTHDETIEVLAEGLGRYKAAWDPKVKAKGHNPVWTKTSRITYEATCRTCGGHMQVGPGGSTTASGIDLRKDDCVTTDERADRLIESARRQRDHERELARQAGWR